MSTFCPFLSTLFRPSLRGRLLWTTPNQLLSSRNRQMAEWARVRDIGTLGHVKGASLPTAYFGVL